MRKRGVFPLLLVYVSLMALFLVSCESPAGSTSGDRVDNGTPIGGIPDNGTPGGGTPKTYTVTFDADGGTPAPAQQNIARDGKVIEPEPMTKHAMGFEGWFWFDNRGEHQWDFANDTVIGDITLYARWNTNFYTVTFIADGGMPEPAPQNIAHEGKASEPSAISKTNYTFGGWFKENNFTNQWNFANDIVTSNITLYAKWTLNQHTVTFNADGGTPAPSAQTIDHGGKVSEPSAISKTNYTFGGWFKEAAFTNQWNFASDIVTTNTTLYAKWTLNLHTVTFNANGGTPAPAPQTIDHGGKVTAPPDMSKTNYTFGGWFKEAAFTNQWNFTSDTVTTNTTLYAKWNINQHTVTFNADGGTPTPSPQTIDHGGKVTAPPDMSKTNYTFGGWFKESSFTNQWNFASDTVTTNTILYAKWTLNQHTVTFNANGGTPAPSPQTIDHGGKVTAPPAVTKTDYVFGGWFKESSFINQWNFANDTVTANTALYARWDAVMQSSRIEYYWVDQHGSLVTTSGGATTIAPGTTLTITTQGSGYVVKQWHLNGVNTGQSGITYNFSSTTIGRYTVGLFIEKDGKLYNTNITVKVRDLTVVIDLYVLNNTGWRGDGALRINVNGVDIATNVRVHPYASGINNSPSGQSSSNKFTFQVAVGDVVQIYWVGEDFLQNYQEDNAFMVYYADTPPSPAFIRNGNDAIWSGSNALVYRLRAANNPAGPTNLKGVTGGTLLGSFTVQE